MTRVAILVKSNCFFTIILHIHEDWMNDNNYETDGDIEYVNDFSLYRINDDEFCQNPGNKNTYDYDKNNEKSYMS